MAGLWSGQIKCIVHLVAEVWTNLALQSCLFNQVSCKYPKEKTMMIRSLSIVCMFTGISVLHVCCFTLLLNRDFQNQASPAYISNGAQLFKNQTSRPFQVSHGIFPHKLEWLSRDQPVESQIKRRFEIDLSGIERHWTPAQPSRIDWRATIKCKPTRNIRNCALSWVVSCKQPDLWPLAHPCEFPNDLWAYPVSSGVAQEESTETRGWPRD